MPGSQYLPSAVSGGPAPGSYVDTTTNQNVNGVKTFLDGIAALSVAFTGGHASITDAAGLTTLSFDAGDRLVYNQATNVLTVVIGGATVATVDASGITQASVNGLVAALAAKATDSAVVHNTGAEAIAGAKTFSSTTTVAQLSLGGGHATLVDAAGLTTLTFDAGDRLNYDQATNVLTVVIGGATVATVDASGIAQASVNGLVAALAAITAALTAVTGNTQAGNYQVVLGDAGKCVDMNVAGANTLTIPTNATVAFPVGTIIEVCQYGAGQTTLTPAGGVTFRSASGLKTRAQYSTVALRQRAVDEWVVSGDSTT